MKVPSLLTRVPAIRRRTGRGKRPTIRSGFSSMGRTAHSIMRPHTGGSDMHKLVLLRHGESTWNLENRFTGWTDVDLSPKGLEEAIAGAKLLKEGGYVFDMAHTSVLKRAIRTLWITLEGMDLMWIPVKRSWRLNERHYGALQGLNKAETAKKFGEEQVKVWRRAYATPPPALTPDDERHPGRDARYARLAS